MREYMQRLDTAPIANRRQRDTQNRVTKRS